MLSKKAYLAVAAAMALTAFAMGQAFPGMGVFFLIAASTPRVACSVRSARLAGQRFAARGGSFDRLTEPSRGTSWLARAI